MCICPLSAHMGELDIIYSLCICRHADQTLYLEPNPVSVIYCPLWATHIFCLSEVWQLPNISLCASSRQGRGAQSIFHLVQGDMGKKKL